MAGALDGIRVLEFASYVSGPYVGMMLADMGAEVIKIEPPERGDPFRGWGTDTLSPTFESLNRNKKSVTLDLKSEGGIRHALRLADSADVLVENYRHGALDRLGLGWEALSARNPRLIYCSITGFGPSGPYRDRPGYDTIGVAMGGLLSLLTDLDDPKPMGYSFADHLAGTSAFQGVMGGLFARERTGRGQRVETSLLEATVSFISENASRYFFDGKVPDRARRTHIAQVFAFVDKDRRPFVIHLSSPPKFWEGLTEVVGHPEWRGDERFAKRPSRIANYDALHDALQAVFATDARETWLDRLRAADVPCGPLNDLKEVFDDPQVQHLQMKQDVPHATAGSLPLVRAGVRLSDTPLSLRHGAPPLGADNETVLGEAVEG
ncbi:MAG: CoA transferase [Alphaproteobacteria bacterium]|nr:CoA transferase [Alphaproteobacteria bacterium]